MMKWLVPIVIVLLGSCNYGLEEPDAPSDLIPKSEMIVIIKDLTKLEAHIQQKYARVDKFYKTMNRSGNHLLKTHRVSQEQFTRSMEYYASDQDVMREMYTEALNLLNEELGEIQQK